MLLYVILPNIFGYNYVYILYMEKYYYKVDTTTELGNKLAALLIRAEEVSKAADSLAEALGATEYIPATEADYGGIAGFIFPKPKLLSKENWTAVQLSDDPKDIAYTPKVTTNTIALPAADAEAYEGDGIVGSMEYDFNQISCLFSRDEAAAMAGITLTTAPLDRLGKQYGLERKAINMLSMGVPAHMMLQGYDDEVVNAISQSQQEDKAITNAFNGVKFRAVMDVKGTEHARSVFLRMLRLPVIPYGTTNGLLGIEDTQYRAGIMMVDDAIYITAHEHCPTLTEITEEEWLAANEIRKAKAAKPSVDC